MLVIISLAMFGNYYVYDSIAPIADMLKSDLGFSDENIGQLYSVYSIAANVLLSGVIGRDHRRQAGHSITATSSFDGGGILHLVRRPRFFNAVVSATRS